jgi:diacylglycerol O-acyltransferase / wax synthase
MERLNAMDASFLYLETPSLHMHVCGVLLLDPSDVDGDFTVHRITGLIDRRLHHMGQFRRKVKGVPLNIDHPIWVDDPDFDLDRHIHAATVEAPGTMHELADFVGTVASRPLERSHPLWEMWLVDGLADGHLALVSKIHHACIDGASGADLMAHLFDLEPEPADADAPGEAWRPQPVPSDAQVTLDALVHRIRNPLRAGQALGRTAGSLINMGRAALPAPIGDAPGTAALPFSAPRTSFNQTLTASRVVAFGQAALDDIKSVKSEYGTTVNDVVLAACALSLRAYLLEGDELPAKPLLASVPVAVHGQGAVAEGINQISNMFVRIPTHLEDPVDVLREIRAETTDAKAMHHAMGADLISDLAQITPPGVFNLAARVWSSWSLADRVPPVNNLIISNVPGPPVPLYVAGARVVGVFPFGPLLEASGLNLTVLSNMGNLDFGVIACGDLVPDPWPIAEGFGAAVDALHRRARADAR